MTKREAVFSKDMENKKVSVVRLFDAPLEQVWKAWTTAEILDLWWAPKPYKAETGLMDFREGGQWLYCMVSPEGAKTWCRVDYHTIDAQKSITSVVVFCDEQGNENPDFPKVYWKKQFSQPDSSTTQVDVEISFDQTADMEMLLKMGFEGGFTAGLNNLDEYLENL